MDLRAPLTGGKAGGAKSSSSLDDASLRRRLKRAKWAHPVALNLTALFLIGGLILGSVLEGGQFGQDSQNNMTPTSVAGIAVFFASLILGAASFSLTLVYLGQAYAVGHLSKRMAVLETVVLMGGCAVGIGLSVSSWLQVDTTYEIQIPGNTWPDYLLQLFGSFAIATFSFLALATFGVFWGLVVGDRGCCGIGGADSGDNGLSSHSAGPKLSSNANPVSRAAGWVGRQICANRFVAVFAAVVLLGCFFAMSTFMNPIWYTGYASYVTGPAAQPMVLPDGSMQFESIITPITKMIGDPNDAQPGYWPAMVVFNLYLDAVVYFSVVIGLLILGCVATAIPRVRSFLHRRVRVPIKPDYFNTFVAGATLGELIVTAAMAGLFSFWLWYWSSSNLRVSYDLNGDGTRWPRTMGHMTTLAMSLLTFPVTKHSPLTSAFGIPFERAIKFHRLLGRICWSAVTVHMILWQVRWLQDGTLTMNILTLVNLTPSAGHTHQNNFTIPLAEFAWLLLTVALLAAGLLRRKSFETFQYTHIAVLFFFLVGIVHAWGHWYYTAGGLLLWAWDKVLRTVNASRAVEIVSLSHAAGVTRLEVRGSGVRPTSPGQYAFLCIPAICPLQFHPFTVAEWDENEEDGRRAVFFIKNMGKGTWTGTLAELALSTSAGDGGVAGGGGVGGGPKAGEVGVSFDGGYGKLGDYAGRDTVVLVAGGIGITPIGSILRDLYRRATEEARNGVSSGRIPRRVHLVWVVRSKHLLTMYADLLAAILSNSCGGKFILHLYATEGASKTSAAEKKEKAKKSKNKRDADAAARIEDITPRAGLLQGEEEAEEDGVGDDDLSRGHTIQPVYAGWCSRESAALVLKNAKDGERPDLEGLVGQAATEAEAASRVSKPAARERMSVVVCGPHELVNSASEVAFKGEFDFHAEVFHW